jgi:signal transduction histidine kinase
MRQQRKIQTEIIKQQDISTRAILQAEENERKRIAADLHDGVGQLMSAAKMNLSAFEHDLPFKSDEQKSAYEKAIALVDESCREVRSISHQMMPNALLKSGLSSAIKEFIDKIDSSIIKINLHTEGLNERLDSNIETVCYRVIQECVNNVIKHSGANTLEISLIKDEDGISATIEDNGKGFNSKEVEKVEGIGLKNIRSRIQYLKGTVDFDSEPGKGTLVAIHVPVG